ncbi:Response regulator of zinc sigma-54-dependent two-component system [Enhygromyxa salina]|uniref:Response regulator of zinc sigma-54-dependent two-component system n=1 Tax=Enhygromyxa salina TaxID=215803 RepID=A0A0C2DHR6_9BACT|nr:sigma-54 dependent transcriptional regulator [Enhygromyxa salina]KIG19197.1 Response regulator of zinc sigma-54-dependent two-component system [Enhygromyxa salina]
MKSRILVVDDDVEPRERLCASLTRLGHEAHAANSGEQALALLQSQSFDALITDVHTGELTGLELCARVREGWPDIPTIVLTERPDAQTVVAALRAGAFDFVTKPVDMDSVSSRLARALQRVGLAREVCQMRSTLSPTGTTLIGDSPALAATQSLVARIADTDVPVLVTGESGVGKELVARELHRQSRRESEPFVAVNCAAIPSQLLESELFGHVRGAFTGANRARDGLFVEAGGGTLFLDEIGELPIETQPKLLRALQERQVRAVGSDRSAGFHARVVTATNVDLETQIGLGRFREDLFYRINVVNVHIPPLRSRGRDVLLLAQYFLDRAATRSGRQIEGISVSVAAKLLAYDWPGNVRELENCIERAVALARYDELTVADLPERISRYELGEQLDEQLPDPPVPKEWITLSELEGRYIREVVRAVKGNKSRAAEILGLARRTLYRRLDRLNGDTSKSDFRPKLQEGP